MSKRKKAVLAVGLVLAAFLIGAIIFYMHFIMNAGQTIETLQKLGAGNVKHYYPVPDHRLPTAVYSDRRLPKKGELTNLSVAYDRPGYRYFSEEAGFDELCREGLFREFADSYLVIWEKS